MSAPPIVHKIARGIAPYTTALRIEGTAVTPQPVEVPLAHGLAALDGETTYRRCVHPRGLLLSDGMPRPLHWFHSGQSIGLVTELVATDEQLTFVALVAPPGTPNMDADLLRRVWRQVTDGTARWVSVAPRSTRRHVPAGTPEKWELSELSVLDAPGRHPAALIHRVSRIDEDGSVTPIGRPANAELPAAPARQTDTTHDEASIRRIVADEIARALEHSAPDGAAMRFCGPWKPSSHYGEGATVQHKHALWVATADTSAGEEPGNGQTRWRMAVKAPHVR